MLRLAKYIALLFLAIPLSWSQAESSAKPDTTKNDSPVAKLTSQPGDSTLLEPIAKQKPEFPKEAIDHGIQGHVMLQLLISETGDVEQVEVISGDPILAKAAVEAAKNWKYKTLH